MTEAQFQITSKSNFIFKNEKQYREDDLFKVMVDNTVYLTAAEKDASTAAIDDAYGYDPTRFYGT